MSGICDTCRRMTCEYRADDIAVCGLPKTETNWERLFGTPERVARTLSETLSQCDKYGWHCKRCDFYLSPVCPNMVGSPVDYDGFIEWLRSDE